MARLAHLPNDTILFTLGEFEIGEGYRIEIIIGQSDEAEAESAPLPPGFHQQDEDHRKVRVLPLQARTASVE